MQRKAKRWLGITLALLLLGGLALFLWNLDPEQREQRFGNQQASCANCRLQVSGVLEIYAFETKGGWYPHGGKTPADSLAKMIVPTNYLRSPGVFTSHALAGKLGKFYAQHQTLTYELMCYRYNEGLRGDDPQNLILMYYFKPTRWECSEHKMDLVGRPVLSAGRGSWDFIPEPEFQTRQKATEEFLKKRTQGGGETEMADGVHKRW